MDFVNGGSNSPIDNSLFKVDKSGQNYRLIVRETGEHKITGRYAIGFNAYYNRYPTFATNMVSMPAPFFTINIIDPCESPLSVRPALEHLEDRVF